ncbi:hypothetical protein PL81_26555, partial [Streptomyces sp. RSD-27]
RPGSGALLPALDADTALAEALWRITGDAATAVAVLDAVFARSRPAAPGATGPRSARSGRQRSWGLRYIP